MEKHENIEEYSDWEVLFIKRCKEEIDYNGAENKGELTVEEFVEKVNWEGAFKSKEEIENFRNKNSLK